MVSPKDIASLKPIYGVLVTRVLIILSSVVIRLVDSGITRVVVRAGLPIYQTVPDVTIYYSTTKLLNPLRVALIKIVVG